MIEQALVLLDTADLPSWSADAPLRREFENLRADVRSYQIASGCDPARAAKKAAQVQERADRIQSFIRGRRCGAQAANGWGFRP